MTKSYLVPILLPADPANPLEAATKQYVDNNRTSAGRIFYLTNDASDIATYYKALDTPSAGAQATFTATVSGTTDFLLAAWATEPGIPGVLAYPAGTAYRRIYANLAGGNTARLHLQVYVRTAAGVETLARDEFSPNFTNTTVALLEWLVSASSVGAMATTDRIVCKLYAQRVAGGASFLVTMYVEGATNASHIQTTIVGGSTGTGTTLDGLSDVTVATPVDGQVLTYNSGTSQWGNEDPPAGGTPTGSKLSALATITGALLAALDLIEVVDVSDTTMSASGTNKKITITELIDYLNTHFDYLNVAGTGGYVELDPVSASPVVTVARTGGGDITLLAAASPVIDLSGIAPEYRINGTSILASVNPSGYGFHRFTFETATTSPPSTRCLRVNNATIASVTQIFIDNTSADGGLVSAQHMTRALGERIVLQRVDGATVGYFRVTTQSATASSTTVNVVYLGSSAALPANGASILVGYEGPANSSETVVGTTRYATAAETLTGTSTSLAAHPAGVAPLVNSGPMFGFLFDTTTTAGSTTSSLRLNNATPASATIVYVDYMSRSGVDLKTRTLAGTAGDRLYIQDKANSANYRIYELTGAPTDNTTYATINVVHRGGGGSLWANGAAIVAGFTAPPITVGTSAPSAPLTNDIWIDTT